MATPQGQDETDGNQDSQTKKYVAPVTKPWVKKTVLSVYFMNREILSTEKYKGKAITAEMILDWANSWKCSQNESIPRFEETTKKKADIRIMFSETESSWTMIGTYAKKVDTKDPTMVLNLFDKHCSHVHQMKSLVVHEFGHALGLENEYQHSDFWDVLEEHVDIERMKSDSFVLSVEYSKGKVVYGSGWFRNSPDSKSSASKLIQKRLSTFGRKPVNETIDSPSEYDPDSMMQYRFDKGWLKNPDHGKLFTIAEDENLSEKEKKYLSGLIKRDGGMASEPSTADIKRLEKAYEYTRSQIGAPKETNESLSVGTPTLPELMGMMHPISAQWNDIGTALGLSQDTLQEIKKENVDNVHCLNDVFHHWVDLFPQATWSELAKALESPSLGLEETVKSIEDKWIKPYQKVSYSGVAKLSQEDITVRIVVLAYGIKPKEIFSEDIDLPIEKVKQLLEKKGQKDLAKNLISRLDEVAQELQKEKLKDTLQV